MNQIARILATFLFLFGFLNSALAETRIYSSDGESYIIVGDSSGRRYRTRAQSKTSKKATSRKTSQSKTIDQVVKFQPYSSAQSSTEESFQKLERFNSPAKAKCKDCDRYYNGSGGDKSSGSGVSRSKKMTPYSSPGVEVIDSSDFNKAPEKPIPSQISSTRQNCTRFTRQEGTILISQSKDEYTGECVFAVDNVVDKNKGEWRRNYRFYSNGQFDNGDSTFGYKTYFVFPRNQPMKVVSDPGIGSVTVTLPSGVKMVLSTTTGRVVNVEGVSSWNEGTHRAGREMRGVDSLSMQPTGNNFFLELPNNGKKPTSSMSLKANLIRSYGSSCQVTHSKFLTQHRERGIFTYSDFKFRSDDALMSALPNLCD